MGIGGRLGSEHLLELGVGGGEAVDDELERAGRQSELLGDFEELREQNKQEERGTRNEEGRRGSKRGGRWKEGGGREGKKRVRKCLWFLVRLDKHSQERRRRRRNKAMRPDSN